MSKVLGWGLAGVMIGAWGCSGAPAPTGGASPAADEVTASDAGDAAIVDRDAKPSNVPEAAAEDDASCPNGRAYCCQASGACGCYAASFCAYQTSPPPDGGTSSGSGSGASSGSASDPPAPDPPIDAGAPAEAAAPAPVLILCVTSAGTFRCDGLPGSQASGIDYRPTPTTFATCLSGGGAPSQPCTSGDMCTAYEGSNAYLGTCK